MSTKAKTPNKRAVKITDGQVALLNTMASQAKQIEEKTELVVATIAAGAGVEKWGKVELNGNTLTFSKAEE
ncbi:hypothetical protein LCGC14_1726410 [marine sediment metagenome]|uniref:Uncharacterized protein n=1 Tax=marine sediment metagenome TaxID=412755 RepID=A0A0F9JRH1_9ZZZZ